MKKPLHAMAGAQPLAVLVFPKGNKKASHQITGTDPANMAKEVAKHVAPEEVRHVRPKVHEALQVIVEQALPVRSMTLEIGGRNIRVRADA